MTPEVERVGLSSLDFTLPVEREASEPPEARGLARDQVKLMVSYRSGDRVLHTQFFNLPCFLNPGDVLVINTSGTLNAALPAVDGAGKQLELHVSTHLPGGLWGVEVRQPGDRGTVPYFGLKPGERLSLPAGAEVTLHAPYLDDRPAQDSIRPRLWLATLQLPLLPGRYLAQYGFPIRYGYVKESWPIEYYQTVYATEPGSAEMPSAGRAFTAELITRLVADGVQVVPLLLHTGVASLESDELPYEEFYRVPLETAHAVNAARARGKRVIAVGTTVVRALETVTDEERTAHPGEGWTRLVITPHYALHMVDGLLTGLHEPRSSHLAMLEALAGQDHLELAYAEALREGYLWHEFGDLHLIL
jgi:S-adenosylmethionine:tRNA ribosyltransferase-isomerase